jgi:cyclic beta-1,2-glucan synthetase
MPTGSLRWQAWVPGHARPRLRASEPPLRSELFSGEQLVRHAKALASAHETTLSESSNQLLKRLALNEEILRDFNRHAVSAAKGEQMTPAGAWLLDNFYLIEEQIQLARRHLPRGYSRELPRLLTGESAGFPRVYDIVLELISHTDAQIDSGSLTTFVAAYQKVQPLKLGELWAIPIMLRLGLIENLQRIASRLLAAQVDRDIAGTWVSRLQKMADEDQSLLVVVVADMAKSKLPLSSSFVAEFCQGLSRQSPSLHLARSWLEQRLVGHGLSIEQLIHEESQNQAAGQVSVSHSLASLRFLAEADWREFVENLSQVDATLREDPADVYSDMTFATRDRYRHAVESTAKYCGLDESEVARRTVQLARASATQHGRNDRTAHIGYYLIDEGLPQLERETRVRLPWGERIERTIRRFPVAFYVGGIAALTLSGSLGFWWLARALDVAAWHLAALTAAAMVSASQLAVAVMNWLSTLLVRPALLPRLDYSLGVTPDCRTVVVMPAMLSTAEGVDRLVESLEIHFLSNNDPLLHFALLTDFPDAATETTPGDDPLLARARAGVETLNAKYPRQQHDRFFLFHRPRRWNASEGVWMGYERKRGKLADFDAVLRGGSQARFSTIVGEPSVLQMVKYVITLDTDTLLPRDAARELVGTMAHPLNRPVFDPKKGIVVKGYGILQPRVGVSLPGAGRSRFVQLFATEAGIDPYTRAVSDVYQDVFGEGSFIGKGIYEVDAFERAMAHRFPENTILSHDLLEACHARSGLVSDIEVIEAYPFRYSVDVGRRHRWMRGDWQIARWLRSRVPGSDAKKIDNPLSTPSQWKIFDNLRRSIVPVAMTFLLLAGWMLDTPMAGAAVLLVLATIAMPGLLPVAAGTVRKPDDLPPSMHIRAQAGAFGRHVTQCFLSIAFLPYEAFVSLDAIGRTWVRLLLTRKKLLEWQTTSDAEQRSSSDLAGAFLEMWIAPVVSVGAAVYLGATDSAYIDLALPILGLWFVSPFIAWWISREIPPPSPDLSAAQLAFLGRITRKTWHFFETFVNKEENWLPPDNFQEIPTPTVASRTSPTNLGLALLANLAARDFGYITIGNLAERTSNTLGTMLKLERHRGHFFNWYDTRTLKPLPPLYVSTVDSGNLAGHLLTLASGLREAQDREIFSTQVFAGLRHTAGVLREITGPHEALAAFEKELRSAPETLAESRALLDRLVAIAARITGTLPSDGSPFNGLRAGEAATWAKLLENACFEHRAELLRYAPWLDRPEWKSGGLGDATPAFALLDRAPTLRELAEIDTPADSEIAWLREASGHARECIVHLGELANACDELAGMDFAFLYDRSKELFTIGYNVHELRRDAGSYDLLASEARLGSFVAIAQGQVPQDHWFSMGRLLVASRGDPVLVSWSGSMFEYLMPQLVMPSYEKTLLDHTCRAVVEQQIRYGDAHGVPWGISESGYNRTDVHLTYQYRAFGVPGMGLKRGLGDDLVIAPYATALALMIAPREACENLERLAADGREGAYGFYEAIDYTPARQPPDETSTTIRSFMVHHQGMSLLSFLYLMRERPMQRRFMACAMLRAADLLLQERVPKTAATLVATDTESKTPDASTVETTDTMRVITNPSSRAPDVQLLSNGRYHVVISSAGGGYSRWHDLAVTRWREDATRDCWGTFIYLRDTETGELGSVAHQPTVRPVKGYEAIFTQDRAEFRHAFSGLEVHTEVCVSPEDDVELRRVTLGNRSSKPRAIELTSYAEVVLATPEADSAHPAFSNLFVQTEFLRGSSAILCTRRARSREEQPPWLLHLMPVHAEGGGQVSCETDRAKFIGRGGNLSLPAAMATLASLSNTAGPVLDPVIALRRTITVPANESVVVDFITGATGNREHALALVEKYQSHRMSDRAFKLAWTHSQVTLRHLGATDAEAQLFDRLAASLIYADPLRRAATAMLRANRRGQNGLWSHGISGDSPILLLTVGDPANIDIVRQVILAHAYWRTKGLAVELVIVNEDVSGYRQSLHDTITSLITSGGEAQMLDRAGGIFIRRLEQLPNDDRILLQAAARVVLTDESGTLAEQLEKRAATEPVIPAFTPSGPAWAEEVSTVAPRELIFNNGLGGFTRDGHEYVMTLKPGDATPAPWVNVIANPHFGTIVSEGGSAYTWLENAHEFRLTPWNNDAVRDPTGEALYIRDEQSGKFWSPTPGPARGATPYVIRHGFGYSVFEHTENGIVSELWIYVAMDAPVKFSVLKLRNISGRHRRISVTGYWEWVLGDLRQRSMFHVQTEVDLKTGALLARNHYSPEFPDRIVFIDVNETSRTVTGDRREFIGRNGNLAQPAALKRSRLSGKVGAGLDPCGVVQVSFELPAGHEREASFRLGAGRNMADVQALVQRFRGADAGRRALEGVWEYWNRTLGAVNVDTPDPAVNVMANGWLLYQTLCCRVWGRSGFYQSGGAFGFRDQLQDTMALVHAEPATTREHLLRAASRQFREGDVQHWWHPPSGRGVRTRFSDDFLWLPYATCRYVACVADTGVLDERVPFIEGRHVKPGEEANYDLPGRSDESATLYEHCVRAIERGLSFGTHGLPLMGCGDWNDGMNRVGNEGSGESVWLAFFLLDVLRQFAPVARGRSDITFADRCELEARKLRENIETHAWDGEWYLRAWFDNGEPLGSAANLECQIDSLPQSWSVISGAGDRDRSRQAMDSVDSRLVRRDAGLIQLFDPPFDKSAQDPGYIKGYIPGVRENGGQYTHGAIWTATAFALMGDHARAWELFDMLNPVNHGATPEQIATYKAEPYVVAADVYGAQPHTGRGGWTWYTGSAGWMYRLLVETLLGINREGDRLRLEPRMPAEWNSFKVHYRFRLTVYHITISRLPADDAEASRLYLDGNELQGTTLPLQDDRRDHSVEFKVR